MSQDGFERPGRDRWRCGIRCGECWKNGVLLMIYSEGCGGVPGSHNPLICQSETKLDRHLEEVHSTYRILCDEDHPKTRGRKCQESISGASENEAAVNFDTHLERVHHVVFEDDEEIEVESATA